MIIIKKYNNRRLYNTRNSEYIILDDIYDMIKNNIDFKVIDAKTKSDITRNILTQIIFDLENTNKNILPINFLKDLIKFYDNSTRNFLTNYLENSMSNFIKNQGQLKLYYTNYFDNISLINDFINNNLKSFFELKDLKGDKII